MTKKLFILSLIGLICATSAYAKCDGGTEVTNTAGTTFCQSNVLMDNWWSAAAWCRANGRKLATIYEMCPSWDGNEGGNKCPELKGKGSGHAWSATASGREDAFYVGFSDGSVGGIYGFRNNTIPAFCR